MTDANLTIPCPACATLNRVPAAKLGAGGKCGRCRAALFEGRPFDLTTRTFEAHAVKSSLPLVVDFWASWCGPCQQMAPAFEEAARRLEPQARLAKVDTEAEPGLAGRFGIRSIPTLLVLSRGREVARQAGAMPADAIVQWARRALAAL